MTSLPPPTALSPLQQKRLRLALKCAEESWNPAKQMLRVPFSSPGYHTTLKGGWVHPIRENFIYAVSLLDTGEEADQERGLALLDRLLDLQDTDPSSKTYGIWSWFYEEPLSQMSPPDWNWADFCGAQLLETALTHTHPYPLQERIKNGIIHAARSIERRNVGPGYTNIAIMGSFVSLAAAETYDLPDLFAYATAKFRNFHAYTMDQGGFTEYNSPTYTLVALDELGRLIRYVRDPEARALATELYRTVWKEIADHFHAPTRQWAGPQSRAYKTLLPERVYGFLYRATEGRFVHHEGEPEIPEHRHVHRCPHDLESSFLSLTVPRLHRQTFFRGTGERPDTIGTTYLAPTFTLGTINAGDMWIQRRALLAFWGTGTKPSSLRLRFLRDGHDFAGAHFFSAQQDGDVVAGIGFAVDGFDTHIFFDPIKNGAIRARDLRLRFEFEGDAVSRVPQAPVNLKDQWTLTDEQFSVSVLMAHAVWARNEGHWERGESEGKAWLDVVLYSGEERTFRLPELTDAACTFAMRCLPGAAKPVAPQLTRDTGRLTVALQDLKISCPAAPLPSAKLFASFSSSVE
jgi:hypothetical protein